MKQELFLNVITEIIEQGIPVGFTGLGIILVDEDIGSLPISSLLSKKSSYSELKNEREIVDFVFDISNVQDIRHDGFHVISLQKGILEISQYFSPIIPEKLNGTIFDVGSRYRTAQYGSLYKNVHSIIVVGQKGLVSVAINGFVELYAK